MDAEIYKSRIDWWIPTLVVVTTALAVIGPVIDGEIFWIGIIIGASLAVLETVMFASVKYQIRDGKLGIRNFLYKWEWFPIDKISAVKKTTGILSAPALSARRVSIKFSDRSVLKSSMPLEISPEDRDGFIARLKEINTDIRVLTPG